MAGNTKFMGFEPDNRVTFERWGKQATFELPGPAINLMREQMYSKLPKKPPIQNPRSDITYDRKTGTIQFNLKPDDAALVREILGTAGCDVTPDEWCKAFQWCDALQEAIREHHAYMNITGEPGVESTPEE